jgi:ribosomal protein S18 acetylase RimI-like enzyme
VIRSLTEADLPAMVGLWSAVFPRRYSVGPDTLGRAVLGCPETVASIGAFAAGGRLEAFAAAKRAPAYSADKRRGHVAAWAFIAPGSGAAVLGRCLSALRPAHDRAAFGMDPDHLWPGCPTDVPWLEAGLRGAGFEPGDVCHDMERDLGVEPDLPAVPLDGLATAPARAGDRSALERFFKAEFPGRWRSDTLARLEEDPDAVWLLWRGREVVGFAVIQTEGVVRPSAGAVWRRSLGPDWAALGPIGIAKALRGRGLGRAFLADALRRLQARGARQTIIDWTVLTDFYGQFGFQPTRTYRSYSLEL